MNYSELLDYLEGKIARVQRYCEKWIEGYFARRGVHLSSVAWVQHGDSGGEPIDSLDVLVVVWEDGTESLAAMKDETGWRYVITPSTEEMERFAEIEREHDGVFHRGVGPRIEIRQYENMSILDVLRAGPK